MALGKIKLNDTPGFYIYTYFFTSLLKMGSESVLMISFFSGISYVSIVCSKINFTSKATLLYNKSLFCKMILTGEAVISQPTLRLWAQIQLRVIFGLHCLYHLTSVPMAQCQFFETHTFCITHIPHSKETKQNHLRRTNRLIVENACGMFGLHWMFLYTVPSKEHFNHEII